MSPAEHERLKGLVLRPITTTSWAWYLWLGILLAVFGAGVAAYVHQLNRGLVVTGMRDTVVWGFYISNFVFFSGLSMAGTFISAILRITGADWRRPLTRLAELSTVAALLMTAIMPIVDMGRPDRILNLLRFGRLESPLLWDLMVIPTYLLASALYLYLFLIPDAALLRDELKGRVSGLRRRLYGLVALGWRGLPEQRRGLERAGAIMTLVVIPIGVATHSVVSWVFGMTFRVGWNSTIFAPYFVVGALYSGTALLIALMFIIRRLYRLEDYFTEQHFRYLGYLMAAFGIVYFYFTFAEYLTTGYKLGGEEKDLLEEVLFGRYGRLVWPGFLAGQVLPVLLAAHPRTRTIPVLFGASLLVNVGMWLKRFIIVVPPLAAPLLPPYGWGTYVPTLTEVGITFGSFAGFALVITLFAKLFPIVSLWETEPEPALETGGPSLAAAASTGRGQDD
jgi:Ni/Fe-hydrogenase subunit HybB-like protein